MKNKIKKPYLKKTINLVFILSQVNLKIVIEVINEDFKLYLVTTRMISIIFKFVEIFGKLNKGARGWKKSENNFDFVTFIYLNRFFFSLFSVGL